MTANTGTASSQRLKDLAMSTTEVFQMRHEQLVPGGIQPREDFEDIPEFSTTVLSAGRILLPLIVKKEKGSTRIEIQDGERRWRAVGYLIQTGKVPADFPIPCISEPSAKVAKLTDADRLLLPLLANTGKPLNMVEKGHQYRRLIEEQGMTMGEIERRLPKTTKQAVSNAVALVRQGGVKLLDMIRKEQLAPTTALEIIKAHPEDHDAQAAMAEQALAAAAAAGKDHATPQHIPKPPKPPVVGFLFMRKVPKGTVHLFNADGVATDPDAAVVTGLPVAWKITELSLRVAKRPEAGAWSHGHTVNVGTSMTGQPVTDSAAVCDSEKSAWLAAWSAMLDSLRGCLTGHPHGEEAVHHAIASLAPQFLDALQNHLSGDDEGEHKTPDGAGESDPAPSASSAPQSEIDNHQSAIGNLHFLPFELVGRPPECSGTGDYQELYRFVLQGIPVQSPLERCHLLLSPIQGTIGTRWGIGWRFEIDGVETEVLPNHAIDNRIINSNVVTFLGATDHLVDALDDQLDGPVQERSDLYDAIHDAWAILLEDILAADEQGHDFLSDKFEKLQWVAKADPNAFAAITSAPSTNRDGSAVGLGNDGGYADTSDRMISANKLLEEVIASGMYHADRIDTAEILLGYLRNERTRDELRTHLLGK